MKKICLAIVVVLAAGCSSMQERVVTVTKPVVVVPPESMFNCPDMPDIPGPGTTDVAVADYILELYETGKICKESLRDVRQFLIDAKKIADEAAKESD